VILVVLEHRDGTISRASWEAATAAQGMASGDVLALLLVGAGVDALAQSAAATGVGPVHVIDHPALEHYAPDPFLHAIGAAVAQLAPALVVMAHSYQARDMAPALAARLSAPLVADVIATTRDGDDLLFRRPMFQGKLVADVRARPPQGVPTFVTCQVGAFRADSLQRGTAAAVTRLEVELPDGGNRQSVEPPFREARQSVDLGQAERIVAVGRGIKAQEHLAVAQALADAMGAELAASRPICDNGWLPMERQVGSSGQTVAPKLYVALGISGAIQHLVGMKGSRTIVAINKDADAPIFEVADYGIVGDLFEIVPAVTSALTKGTS
jgi:electron transfer flavoprotein alpha subunit